jgi:hypothetical protein
MGDDEFIRQPSEREEIFICDLEASILKRKGEAVRAVSGEPLDQKSDVGGFFAWEGDLKLARKTMDCTTESSDVYAASPDARGSHTSDASRKTAGTYIKPDQRVW